MVRHMEIVDQKNQGLNHSQVGDQRKLIWWQDLVVVDSSSWDGYK